MKKLSKSISKNYKMPHLYLEDVKEIEEAIKEAKPRIYKITIDNYEYENVAEIPRDISPVYEMDIYSYSPYISIEFRKLGATVYMGEDDLVSAGVFTKIDKVLTKAQRKLLWLPSSNMFISAVFGVIIGQLVSRTLPIDANPFKIVPLILAVLLSIYMIFSFKTALSNYCVIEFLKRSEKKSFLEKNQDQIVLIAFGAIIGAIITVLLEKILLK